MMAITLADPVPSAVQPLHIQVGQRELAITLADPRGDQ